VLQKDRLSVRVPFCWRERGVRPQLKVPTARKSGEIFECTSLRNEDWRLTVRWLRRPRSAVQASAGIASAFERAWSRC
jgi:hypothetical protein